MQWQIERRTELALRALRLLEEEDRTMRAKEIAPALGTTVHYLPQVLSPLVRAGWLDSEPGPTGGYRLAEDFDSRSLLELIELIEGPIATDRCVLRGGPCGDINPCVLHESWLKVRTALIDSLARIPVSGAKKGKTR